MTGAAPVGLNMLAGEISPVRWVNGGLSAGTVKEMACDVVNAQSRGFVSGLLVSFVGIPMAVPCLTCACIGCGGSFIG